MLTSWGGLRSLARAIFDSSKSLSRVLVGKMGATGCLQGQDKESYSRIPPDRHNVNRMTSPHAGLKYKRVLEPVIDSYAK